MNRTVSTISAYLFAGGLFQCGTWGNLPIHIYRIIHHSIIGVYRSITGNKYDFIANCHCMFSDEALISEYNLKSHMVMLRAARLQLFCRIIAKESAFLLGFLRKLYSSNVWWISSLKSDFAWLSLCGQFNVPCDDLHALEAHIAPDPWRFKKTVCGYAGSEFANLDVPKVFSCFSVPSSSIHHCPRCAKTFDSIQKLNLHLFKAQGLKNPIRRLVSTSTCPICLTEFHTRTRILNHLRYRSHVCRCNLLIAGPLLSVEADLLDFEEAVANRLLAQSGSRAHKAALPCIRVQGPLPAPILIADRHSSHHILGFGRNYTN